VKSLIRKILKEERESLSYNEEDKTLTGRYKIIGDYDKYIEVENEQEFIGHKGKTNIGYMDGKLAGTSYLSKAKLPKSQITIGDVDDDGLTTITFPYWLYKKIGDSLKITGKLDRNIYRVKPND
jgi:hypothetical protein